MDIKTAIQLVKDEISDAEMALKALGRQDAPIPAYHINLITAKKTMIEYIENILNQPPTSNLYDKEEIYDNCTVQVWTNTETGDTSVGWWEND